MIQIHILANSMIHVQVDLASLIQLQIHWLFNPETHCFCGSYLEIYYIFEASSALRRPQD